MYLQLLNEWGAQKNGFDTTLYRKQILQSLRDIGNNELCIEILNNWKNQDGFDLSPYRLDLIQCHESKGDYDVCLKMLNEWIDGDLKRKYSFRIYMKQGKFEECLEILNTLREQSSSSFRPAPFYHTLLAHHMENKTLDTFFNLLNKWGVEEQFDVAPQGILKWEERRNIYDADIFRYYILKGEVDIALTLLESWFKFHEGQPMHFANKLISRVAHCLMYHTSTNSNEVSIRLAELIKAFNLELPNLLEESSSKDHPTQH